MKTLVLGLGNPILSDDSVGFRVVQQLKARFDKRIRFPEKFEGAEPLQNPCLPLLIGIYIHIMERGIKGVRLINNLY